MDLSSRSTPSPTARPLVGWVLESPGCGTLSIILSCLSTINLCTWVVIHPRVRKLRLHRWLHKTALFLKTILAPELIAVEGLQEWSQARNTVKKCEGLTRGRLKLIQAFYVGMLALKYRTALGEKVIWPNQYTWLLEQGLVDWDDHTLWGLSEENIRDKSNADGTTKLLALGQVLWFIAQSVMRRAHGLPLSQVETMTLSYIPLVAVTYFFWWIKPKDVLTPSIVDLPDMHEWQRVIFESMAVDASFDNEGLGKQDSLRTIWYLTPRVFEKEAEDKRFREAQEKSRQRSEQTKVKSGLQANSIQFEQAAVQKFEYEEGGNKRRRVPEPCEVFVEETVLACWDPVLYHSKVLWPVICLFGASFGALHLIAWYTIFPTIIEQWLWRAAALVSIISLLVFMQFEKVILRWGGPLTVISLVSPVLYLVSRIIMIGGVVAAFRASDPAIYDTYTVSTYWIHIL